jgi:hypothetical protein
MSEAVMRAPSDLVEVESAREEPEYDWSGWEKWLRAHLDIEREDMIESLGDALGMTRVDLLNRIEPQLKKLELKLAELTGAVDVLRGKQPPLVKFPVLEHWEEDRVYHEGELVVFSGASYQAIKDTARVPTAQDWRCIAARGNDGRDFNVRGTFDPSVAYQALDVVTLNHGWFVAKRDNPGPCPGNDWQSGPVGKRGDKGERGPRGLPGPSGQDALEWVGVKIDRSAYALVAVMSVARLSLWFNRELEKLRSEVDQCRAEMDQCRAELRLRQLDGTPERGMVSPLPPWKPLGGADQEFTPVTLRGRGGGRP